MPTPRKYSSSAARQAAYRQRLARAKETSKTNTWPTKPGYRRWKVMTKHAKDVLDIVLMEMQDYFDERSDAWQESEHAETFTDKMDTLTEAIDALEQHNS